MKQDEDDEMALRQLLERRKRVELLTSAMVVLAVTRDLERLEWFIRAKPTRPGFCDRQGVVIAVCKAPSEDRVSMFARYYGASNPGVLGDVVWRGHRHPVDASDLRFARVALGSQMAALEFRTAAALDLQPGADSHSELAALAFGLEPMDPEADAVDLFPSPTGRAARKPR